MDITDSAILLWLEIEKNLDEHVPSFIKNAFQYVLFEVKTIFFLIGVYFIKFWFILILIYSVHADIRVSFYWKR